MWGHLNIYNPSSSKEGGGFFEDRKCKLCLIKDANQTGSHMIPFFILRTIDNENNSKERDKELGFVISPSYSDSYFGRGILPEMLNTIYGDLTDDETETKGKSPFILDNILCTDCERFFSVVESEYAAISINLNAESPYESMKGVIPILLWTSILWRVSVTHAAHFKLKYKHENELRNFLVHYSGYDLSKLYNTNKVNEIEYSYTILRYHNPSRPLCAVFHPSHFQPYCFIVGEYVIFYYMKKSYTKMVKSSFFGFEKRDTTEPLSSCNREIVVPLKDKEFSIYINNLNHYLSREKTLVFEKKFEMIFKKFIGSINYKLIKKEVFDRLAHNEEKIGRAYSDEHFLNIVLEVFVEYKLVLRE